MQCKIYSEAVSKEWGTAWGNYIWGYIIYYIILEVSHFTCEEAIYFVLQTLEPFRKKIYLH